MDHVGSRAPRQTTHTNEQGMRRCWQITDMHVQHGTLCCQQTTNRDRSTHLLQRQRLQQLKVRQHAIDVLASSESSSSGARSRRSRALRRRQCRSTRTRPCIGCVEHGRGDGSRGGNRAVEAAASIARAAVQAQMISVHLATVTYFKLCSLACPAASNPSAACRRTGRWRVHCTVPFSDVSKWAFAENVR